MNFNLDSLTESLGFGGDYDKLTPPEKEDYQKILTDIEKTQITVDSMKDYVSHLRQTIDTELSKFDNSRQKDLYLKARLNNIILIESFLAGPERARKQLEATLKGLSIKREL